MKTHRIIVALMAMVGTLSVKAADVAALRVRQLTLSNGLTVWLNEDHSQPKVYGALVVKAGAKDCPNTGIAHYLEHVLFKGTQKIGTVDYEGERLWLDSISAKYNELSQAKDPQQRLAIQADISRLSQRAADYAIPNEFERLISKYGGSELNASTSYDITEYHNTFAPQFLQQWCELNSERMLNPVFRLFQGELETVYEEKNRAADDMLRSAIEHIMAKVFEGHPYQYPIIGSTENLKNPRLQDMEDFFRRYYVAGNMGLMLSGDFTAEGIEPLLERTFGRLPRGQAPKAGAATLKALGGETLDVKVNMPLVKAVGLLFRGPVDNAPDAHALELAMSLLSNDYQTGLLDSLRIAHKVMLAVGGRFSFNEAGAVGVIAIPKLPFGSKKKAEKLLWQQVERLKRGNFTEEQLEQLKQQLLQSTETSLEGITERAQLMGRLFSQGRTWDDYLLQVAAIKATTKADVVAAANRYLQADHYLRGVKRFGSYAKDKVTQPGYKAVVPKHARAMSAYAQQLAQQPVDSRGPRLVDLKADAEVMALGSEAILYKVDNTVNDLFSLSVKWLRGERDEPRQQLLDAIVGELGTDSLTKHQLGSAWQQLGTTFSTKSEDKYFMLTIKGFDRNLEASLKLLGHVVGRLKPDKEAMKEVVDEYKMSRRQLDRTNSTVMQLVAARIMKGERSQYLLQPTVSEVKGTTAEQLLQLLDDLRQYHCDILYSGNHTAADVAKLCRRYLALERSTKASPDSDVRLVETTENMVYVYDMPDSRQTLMGIYGTVKPSLNDREEAALRLWSQYMGGGMSSVLFQEVREFRAMAYSTGAQLALPNRARHADHPSAYVALLGTQADKAMQALAVLDSLMEQMPVSEQNVDVAKQAILNDFNNSYPMFRQLPGYVSTWRANGYHSDPRTSASAIVPTLSAADMVDFYSKNIKQKPRAIFIIGNKKLLDLSALERYGRVVMLKKNDVMR